MNEVPQVFVVAVVVDGPNQILIGNDEGVSISAAGSSSFVSPNDSKITFRKLAMKEKVDMLFLQEPKRDRLEKLVCQLLWGDQDVMWAECPAVNSAGGILCVWSDATFTEERRIIGNGFILLEGFRRGEGERITLVNIYLPCDSE